MTHLPHVNRDLTALADDPRRIRSLHPLLEIGQDLGRGDASKGLGSFVSNHVGLIWVLEDGEERRNRMGGEKLTEDECNLVSEKSIMVMNVTM